MACGEAEIALQLIEHIVDASATLGIQNKRGDTPLHLAATRGILEVCKQLVRSYRDGVTVRNHNGETPVFLAALHGKQKAFNWLHLINQEEEHLERDNGDTVLHVTVAGNYFSK